MQRLILLTILLAPGFMVTNACSAEPTQSAFQAFVKSQADLLRRGDEAPATLQEWQQRRAELRDHLITAWGKFPEKASSLEAQVLGTIKRDGYRVERVVFQTLPGVWMTANAYVPELASSQSPVPAVLCVHGHWAGAKQDPVVQSRCIGLVKLGFFVLAVDAFGAGERGVSKNLGEYHGEMTGAMLFPVGRPLSGIQVYENMRAVDYIQSRSEVDPKRIGITGASGGGNQTMYAGGFDERFSCIVPTCSVGTYRSYLSAACCMCEVVPGGLSFTEEGDVLGLSVDRGLMVTSATKDAFQFSVSQAQISVGRADRIGRLLGEHQTKHTIIESPHHYNQPMREAMYGWMTLHLKGKGQGTPIAEPEIRPEEPETIRCFPGTSRPEGFMTIPRFAFEEGQKILQQRAETVDKAALAELKQADRNQRARLQEQSVNRLAETLGGIPARVDLRLESGKAEGQTGLVSYDSEDGIRLSARLDSKTSGKLAVLLDFEQTIDGTLNNSLANQLRRSGWRVMVPQLRATGSLAVASDKIGHAPDHNSAEWSLWIGRPLLGQWSVDVRATIDAVAQIDGSVPGTLAVVGSGSAGLVALTAAALDQRISHVVAIESMASYVSDQPYRNQRLGLMVNDILNRVGDIGHIAAMIAPRKVVIAGAVEGDGKPMQAAAVQKSFEFAEKVYQSHGVGHQMRIQGPSQIVPGLDDH